MELGVKDHGRDLGVPLNEGVDQAVHQPVEIALGVGKVLALAGAATGAGVSHGYCARVLFAQTHFNLGFGISKWFALKKIAIGLGGY